MLAFLSTGDNEIASNVPLSIATLNAFSKSLIQVIGCLICRSGSNLIHLKNILLFQRAVEFCAYLFGQFYRAFRVIYAGQVGESKIIQFSQHHSRADFEQCKRL